MSLGIEPVGRAAAAYAANASAKIALTTPPVETAPLAPTDAAATAASNDFGSFIGDQITSAIDTVRAGEKASLAAAAGKAGAQEVVRSVLAAEMTVQAVVSVRDRLVQAYQDVMRMAI